MDEPKKHQRLPQYDSIEQLAEFWDTHDLTDFEDELEQVDEAGHVVIQKDGDWFIAHCPEIPGANGQGRTETEARKSLADAVRLILEDHREGAK